MATLPRVISDAEADKEFGPPYSNGLIDGLYFARGAAARLLADLDAKIAEAEAEAEADQAATTGT